MNALPLRLGLGAEDHAAFHAPVCGLHKYVLTIGRQPHGGSDPDSVAHGDLASTPPSRFSIVPDCGSDITPEEHRATICRRSETKTRLRSTLSRLCLSGGPSSFEGRGRRVTQPERWRCRPVRSRVHRAADRRRAAGCRAITRPLSRFGCCARGRGAALDTSPAVRQGAGVQSATAMMLPSGNGSGPAHANRRLLAGFSVGNRRRTCNSTCIPYHPLQSRASRPSVDTLKHFKLQPDPRVTLAHRHSAWPDATAGRARVRTPWTAEESNDGLLVVDQLYWTPLVATQAAGLDTVAIFPPRVEVFRSSAGTNPPPTRLHG